MKNILKEIKSKTWIDWVKVLVAIDIAGVGVGLVLGFNMHVLAHALGFVTQIIFGVLYVIVAALIFRRVFPDTSELQSLHVDTTPEVAREENQIESNSRKKIFSKIEKITDAAHDKIDDFIDRGENFIDKRRDEVRDEFKKIMKN